MEQTTIVVDAKSPFGVMDKESGKWLNPVDNKMLKDFVIGKEYIVNLVKNKGKNGKTYLNIDSYEEVEGVPSAYKTVEDKKSSKAFPAKAKPTNEASEKDVKAVDWAAKDRSQLVGGRSHDAAVLVQVSLQSCTPMDDVLKLYKQALEGILIIAEEVK